MVSEAEVERDYSCVSNDEVNDGKVSHGVSVQGIARGIYYIIAYCIHITVHDTISSPQTSSLPASHPPFPFPAITGSAPPYPQPNLNT